MAKNASRMFELIEKYENHSDNPYKRHVGARIDALINLLIEKGVFTKNEFEDQYESECGKRVAGLEEIFEKKNPTI